MTLESIVKEVLRQGKVEADGIKKDYGKRALQAHIEADMETKKQMHQAKKEAEKEGRVINVKKLSSVELEVRKLELKAKAEVLDSLKMEVLDRLKGLSTVEREKSLRKLLNKARNIIPEGTVFCDPKDQDIVRANMGSYRLGDSQEMTGGIVVESTDRKKRLDLSFDALFEEIWDNNISEVMHTLFKGAQD